MIFCKRINDICNKEAALHYKEDTCPKLPTAPNQLIITFDTIPITTKNGYCPEASPQKTYTTYLKEKF